MKKTSLGVECIPMTGTQACKEIILSTMAIGRRRVDL